MNSPEQTEFPRIVPAGDAALVVELGQSISRALNESVRELEVAVGEAELPEIVATIPTYRSLLVYYDPGRITFAELAAKLRVLRGAHRPAPTRRRRWILPVCYGGTLGFDLEAMARQIGITADRVATLHSSAEYMVYMIGFSPGYAYLGELPEALAIPRKSVPTPEVPASTVMVGGMQTGISSVPMPTGWYVIGRTPVALFDRDRARPFLLDAGDLVRFASISPDEFQSLTAAVTQGAFEPEWSWQA